jgi:hypothetical protein
MQEESATDTLNDETMCPKWEQEQRDRLISWELLCRYVRHESELPMSNVELCDRIGTSKSNFFNMMDSIKHRLNAK